MHVHQHCALLMKNEFTNTTHPKQFQWSQTCLDKLTTIIISSQNSTKCNCYCTKNKSNNKYKPCNKH